MKKLKAKKSPFLSDRWVVSYHWLVPGDVPATKLYVATRFQEIPVKFEGRGPLRLK